MIYILSSTHAATGGTELLQQLCFQLNNNGIPAVMFYTEKYEESKVQLKFEKMYRNPFTNHIEDEAVAVVPETEIDSFQKIKREFSKIYIWWLSVDNYYASGRNKTNIIRDAYRNVKHFRNIKLFKMAYHCVQSEYARLYLTKEIGIVESRIFYLSDYINEDYLKEKNISLSKKENIILYNPKKGYEFTQKLIKMIPEYEWVALINMSNSDMVDAFSRAKLYVDFGNHPGKDRIPREAAVFMCCIITGKKGSANNSVDVPINEKYKFNENDDDIILIKDCVRVLMSDFDKQIEDYSQYREMIYNEKNVFINDALKIFGDN